MRRSTSKDAGRRRHGARRTGRGARTAARLMAGWTGTAILLLPLLLAFPTPGRGQDLPVDVTVKVVDGTTREPGRADTVSLLPLQVGRQALETAFDVEGEVILAGLELSPALEYVVEATAEGIPYYARATGRALAESPLTVYVFQTTAALDSVSVAGMNLILRRGEDELQLEYLFTIQNDVAPQRAVLPSPSSLALALPDGLGGLRAEILSRPSPAAVGTAAGPEPGWIGLAAPLPPGPTRIRLTGVLPYDGAAELPVGANLAVSQWSVLAFPPDLEIRGEGMEEASVGADVDYSRSVGPALAAGATLVLEVRGGAAPVVLTGLDAGDSVAVVAPASSPPPPDEKTSSVTWILIFLGLVLVYLVFRIRRRS